MIASTTKPNKRRTKRVATSWAAAAALTFATALPLSHAHAGATVSFGDDKSISLGFGMRTSYSSVEDGAPDGKSRSSDFTLNSARIYMGGQLTPYIKGTFNTEIDSATSTMRVIDAIAQFEFMDEFNVWVGRMLPPSDRANLDGPYYENAWDYPDVSMYPSKTTGRDDGITVWGKLMDKKVVYAFGAFEGNRTAVNRGDHPLLAGRVAVNILDPEGAPAYYTGSTYYGSSHILTIAVAGMTQKDGVGATVAGVLRRHKYSAWNVDALFEEPVEGVGTFTVEGAYYNYNTGKDAVLEALGGAPDGKAFLITGEYMTPEKIGWGYVQPFVRYQHEKSDTFGIKASRLDVGVNYVISGPNARISAVYSNNTPGPTGLLQTTKKDKFLLGLQLQF